MSSVSNNSADIPGVSLVVNPLKRKRGLSIKSNFFQRVDNCMQCKQCDKKFSLKTSHTVLKKHSDVHQPNFVVKERKRRNEKNKHLERLLINFIVHGSHSFRIVEEEHFKLLISELNPGYSLPNRHHLTLSIKTLFENTQYQLINRLREVKNKISITLDYWTSVTNKPYIAVTAHFMLNNSLVAIILDFDLVPYPHTSDHLLSKIIEIFDNYSLKGKIISISTDNESSNVKMMQMLTLFHDDYEDVVHTRCLAHVLNLVVKSGLEKLDCTVQNISKLVNIINFSPKKKQMYFEYCDLNDVKRLSLLREISTRWNSTYLMLLRALDVRSVLDQLCDNVAEFHKYKIEHWEQVDVLLKFLKPFYDATLLMSMTKYPSIFCVVPIVDEIQKHILNNLNNELVNDCATAMNDKLHSYILLLRSKVAKIAVVLDPRLKDFYFKDYENLETTTETKRIFQDNYKLQNNDEQGNIETNLSGSGFLSSIYRKKDINQDEFDKYLSLPLEPENTDVLAWWKSHEYEMPQLKKMAFDYLAIPGSSVPSEQVFSKSANLITKRRNRLDNKRFKLCLCEMNVRELSLRYWLKKIESSKIDLCWDEIIYTWAKYLSTVMIKDNIGKCTVCKTIEESNLRKLLLNTPEPSLVEFWQKCMKTVCNYAY